MEHGTGRESDEDMYLHVAGPDAKDVEKAKELCEDLLGNVREQYEEFKARGPQRGYGDRVPSTGYGGQSGYGDRQSGYGDRQSGYGDRQSSDRPGSYGGYGGYNSPAPVTPTVGAMSPPGAAPGAAGGADYAAQYAQYYGGADPYAAYGGYAAYVRKRGYFHKLRLIT